MRPKSSTSAISGNTAAQAGGVYVGPYVPHPYFPCVIPIFPTNNCGVISSPRFIPRGEVHADEILVGGGCPPNVEGLNLEVAGMAYDPKSGVRVNDYLQTSNPNVYATGDICSRIKLTHAADVMARVVIQDALIFRSTTFSAFYRRQRDCAPGGELPAKKSLIFFMCAAHRSGTIN
jgi:hypothetical protein